MPSVHVPRAASGRQVAPSVILLPLLAAPNLKEMALRCLLFTSERERQADSQVLAGLGVEGEHCSEAAEAVEKVLTRIFRLSSSIGTCSRKLDSS